MKKTLLTAACTLFLLSGCKDYLNITPKSTLVEDSYYTNTGEVETGVINIYSALQNVVPAEIVLSELRSDNMAPNLLEGDWGTIETFAETPSNDFVGTFWRTAYATIAQANIVLKYLGNVTDADKKARFEGEAKFARALMHFDLVRLYGDVPLVTTTLTSTATEELRRRPTAEVYATIITDLQTAVATLPTTWDAVNVGRATKGAAQTLLAKVYLTQGNYAAARPLLESVISSTTYQLLPSYANVFAASNEMNREIIFAIRYKTASNGEGQGFSYDLSKDGNLRGKPQVDLQALYVAGDTRLTASTTGTGSNMYVNKFADAANTGSRRDSGTDWIVLRYADVLLMYAEVLNELGDTPGALSRLNAVRTRSGAPAYATTPTPSKATVQANIELERRLELVFEDQRWYDLLRTGRAQAAMNAHFQAIGRTNLTVPTYRLLYPIPQREIDLSKGIITQNPGYN
jgi:hypothetical protein